MREIFISLNFFIQVVDLKQKAARFFFLPLCFLLVGCIVRPADLGSSHATYFRPPTPRVVFTPTHEDFVSPPNGGAASTASTLPCKDSLTFVKDLTIPDGTEVAPESTLDKRWEVENNGGCNWGEGYHVRLIAGPELGGQKEQALYPARSGSRAVIRMQFKAPGDPATYRSAWQAFNPQGEPFGDPFFIEIKVVRP